MPKPKIDLETRIQEKPHVTKEDIKAGLRELGLGEGDCVGVHSSLSRFGYVEGGADAVIDAIQETVGDAGTVVMPAYSTNIEWIEVTEEDRKLGVTRKRRYLPYKPEAVSCWTGRIPDTFWRREGAVRGPNPTHSLSAIGPKAEELCQGWDRLLEADGYILLLGITLKNCSSMHLAERKVRPPKSPEPPGALKALMEKYEAEGLRVNVDYPGQLCYPDFEKLEGPCRERGVMKSVLIGESTVKLFRLRELIDLFAEYIGKAPELFYYTRTEEARTR